MNQLLPIVRRVRRPLVVEIKPPVVVANVEPVTAEAAAQSGRVALEETVATGRQESRLADAADDTPDSTASSASPTVAPL